MVELTDRIAGKELRPRAAELFVIELADGRKIRASDLKMAGKPALERIEADAKSIRLSGRFPGWKATVPLVSADGKVQVSWTAMIRDQANCVRQELTISPVGGVLPIKQLTVIDFAAPGAQTDLGAVDGSPVFSGNLFFACEHPMAHNVANEGRIASTLPRFRPIDPGEKLTVAWAFGVVPTGQLRRGFLYYVERQRVRPYSPFVYYICRRNGLEWHSESGGPWNRKPAIFGEADQLAFLARNDMPQGEYWWNGEGLGGRQMSRPQAMTAHVYGKRLAAAEAFTHMRRHWTTYPAMLKRCGDESFVDGVNHLVQPRAVVASAPSTGQLVLDGPWDVSFLPGRGAPAKAVFDSLIGWDKHSDTGIRHFSGTATYRKTFEISETDSVKPVWLQLGSVGAVAQVRLNGKDLGVVWTAPWKLELTGLLKSGRNVLEIEVTNAWANRLIGDAALPLEQRITKSNLQYEKGKRTLKNFQGFASSDALQPSGLMGPVMLDFY